MRWLIDFDRAIDLIDVMKLSPRVRGIAGFSWAMTVRALCTAATFASTLVLSEQNPWMSGGLTLMSAISNARVPLLNRCGMSDRKIGT